MEHEVYWTVLPKDLDAMSSFSHARCSGDSDWTVHIRVETWSSDGMYMDDVLACHGEAG